MRLEAFNSLNKVNLGTPNRFVNTAQFGTITESSTPGRQIQLSARLSYQLPFWRNHYRNCAGDLDSVPEIMIEDSGAKDMERLFGSDLRG